MTRTEPDIQRFFCENNVRFDGSASTNVDYVLFHFENVAKIFASSEKRAQSLTRYARRRTFDFYSWRFSKSGTLINEAKRYGLLKAVLCEEFATKPDPQKAIESALSLKLYQRNSAYEFAVSAEKEYIETK